MSGNFEGNDEDGGGEDAVLSGVCSFGEAVRARRDRVGMTQRQLAGLAGVSVRAVRYIESGQVRHPRVDSVRRLASAVGLDPEDWPAASASRLAVLGPLELRLGGRPVDPGPRKQRSLLALLALHAGRVVDTDEIVDVLWGDDPPPSCRNLVHTYVARLRRVLAADTVPRPIAVHTAIDGYALGVDEDQSDVLAFTGLVDRADRADARDAEDVLTRALACWRGRALADAPQRLRHHPTAQVLAHRRIEAATALADLLLSRGAVRRVGTLLGGLVAEEPLHEGVHLRLLRALAASGQQAAAVRLYGDLRARLVEHLGVEPGAELRAAYQDVLSQDAPAGDDRP